MHFILFTFVTTEHRAAVSKLKNPLMRSACIFLFVITVFAQCESDSPEDCSTPATVRDLTGLDGCGWVFELEDGTRLEPFRVFRCGTPPLSKETTEDPLLDFEFVDGKRVFIDYEIVHQNWHERADSVSICMVGPMVRITCITEAVVISAE